MRYPEEEITAALAGGGPLIYDPQPQGLLDARRAIGGCPERIVLTASTSESYSFLFKLLCDPGDEVLIPQPSYPLFDFLAELESVCLCRYPLFHDQGWAIDIEGLRNAITPRCRALVLVNPNNPTGSFLKRSEYVEIAKICAAAGVAIISDEVFAGYEFGEDSERVITLSDRDYVLTFSLGGLSKSAGLPQMKLGWITVAGPDDTVREALARLELIADTFLSVNTPVQRAAARLIESGDRVRRQIRERTRNNLEYLRRATKSEMDSTMLRVLDVEAGWYAIVHAARTRSEEQWVLGLLEEEGVLVQPGYFFDFQSEPFLVLSLLTPEDIFHEGVRRLIQYATC